MISMSKPPIVRHAVSPSTVPFHVPLTVEVGIQYELDLSLFPGLDKQSVDGRALMVAPSYRPAPIQPLTGGVRIPRNVGSPVVVGDDKSERRVASCSKDARTPVMQMYPYLSDVRQRYDHTPVQPWPAVSSGLHSPDSRTRMESCRSNHDTNCTPVSSRHRSQLVHDSPLTLSANIHNYSPYHYIGQFRKRRSVAEAETPELDHPEAAEVPSTKRQRTSSSKRVVLDTRQRLSLEQVFQQNMYPDRAVKESLAAAGDMAFSTVQNWFNRRRKLWRQQQQELKDANVVVSRKTTVDAIPHYHLAIDAAVTPGKNRAV